MIYFFFVYSDQIFPALHEIDDFWTTLIRVTILDGFRVSLQHPSQKAFVAWQWKKFEKPTTTDLQQILRIDYHFFLNHARFVICSNYYYFDGFQDQMLVF